MEAVCIILSVITGAFLSALLACIPGIHVYNLLAFAVIGAHYLIQSGINVQPFLIAPFFCSMITSYSILSTIPSIILAAPDESSLFTVLPGQKYFINGHGYQGVIITAAGGLASVFILVLGIAPLAPKILPPIRAVLKPHMHWILWSVICFLIMSEWPKNIDNNKTPLKRLLAGWKSTGAGLLTFLLSGLLGFLIIYRSPISSNIAFQNMMPAFVGLFTIPWLILNIASNTSVTKQDFTEPEINGNKMLHGLIAGSLGGGLSAFLPAITGGLGGLLAGHATSIRDDQTFLVSQGASKLIYYTGGLMFLFVPGLNITRGGGASMLKTLFVPTSTTDYMIFLSSICLAGMIAFLLVAPAAKLTILLVAKYGFRQISSIALFVTIILVASITGLSGLLILIVATGIGLIPVLCGSRRLNCLGVILLPIACAMSGIGAQVAKLLGLI